MKVATVPWPLKKDALPLPARVDTFHTQGGSALSPTPAQFAGVIQGVAGAGVPPGQKYPTAHWVALAGDTEPAGHPKPGRAVQVPLHAARVRFTTAPKYPGGHGEGLEDPARQKLPVGHPLQLLLEVAPLELL